MVIPPGGVGGKQNSDNGNNDKGGSDNVIWWPSSTVAQRTILDIVKGQAQMTQICGEDLRHHARGD
jgi:hypothetical protein